MSKNGRRGFLKAGVAAAAGGGGAQGQPAGPVKKVHYRGAKPNGTPMFSGAVSYGNLLFIAGKGYHKEGDIKVHTKAVLDEVQAELEHAGSAIDKVLQCRLLFNDLEDYVGIDDEVRRWYGDEAPVRAIHGTRD